MKVTVSNVGEKIYYIAVNLLGSDNQQYTIISKTGMLNYHCCLIILQLTSTVI